MSRQPLVLNPVFLTPMYEDGEINQKGIQTISLRNAGTATVNIQMGMWTLAPGETLHISVVDNIDSLDFSVIQISFDVTLGSEKKLQILILRSVTKCD